MNFFRIAVCIFLAVSVAIAPSADARKHSSHYRSKYAAKRSRGSQTLSQRRFALATPVSNSSNRYKARKSTRQSSSAPLIAGSQSLSLELNNIVNSASDGCNVGVAVKSMKYGDILYSRNANQAFVPASTLKVLTAEAGLLFLGSEYKFPTRVLTDAKSVNHGVLNGNLYLVQTGDPTLTYKDLENLMADLKAQQIQIVTGNVYIDNTAYDQMNHGPGWMWDDKRYCFAAPISASIINHNCLHFKMAPTKPGKMANIIGDHFYYSAIENNVVTKPSSYRSCYIHLNDITHSQSSALSVTGCMPKGSYTQTVSTVINNITQYNLALVRNLFSSAGIEIQGTVLEGRASNKLLMVSEHYSKPLHTLITRMLKISDNIIAGSVFKKIGELYSGRPGSWENGSAAVKQILAQKAGLNTKNLNVTDGSGLSQFNAVSPFQMLQVLDFAFHDHPTNYEFISALPIAGVDGTLKSRLQHVAGKIRAKTGTLKEAGVVSLAGYAMNKDKEPVGFVIMVNGRKGSAWKYKELEDRIVTALTRFTRL